ncbi:sigma-54 interaction domain-containing protein [Alkalicoccus daliensis]|uniref:HTH-type transcriptional regulatory protein TyrR n=1 Tax=Alkalicoccus daliensis TaxID=745820 RepID=A0A1H0J195_9BACI|nr:sigma 54-interacting transcriptional regulator [Alkalicoccus daliensis]SDO37199.1 PAS domain S-box-containing protein [Alkalicoccus daliensis]
MKTLLSKDYINILELLQEGIYVVDGKANTLMVNKAYEKLSGLNRAQLVGRNMKDLEKEGYISRSVSLLVFKERKIVSLVQQINDRVEASVTGHPIWNDKNEIEMVITTINDVTQLNSASRKLEKAQGMLELQNNEYAVTQKNFDHHLIFKSKTMRDLYRMIVQIAPYPTSVLITGPTGAGKEVVSNAIQELSPLKEGPFIKVNCGAIPHSLMESEFFGYEPGTFTGAKKEGKFGLLELAHGGTLLLDEIGEMPLDIQIKLLRVLQEKQVQRLGSSEARKADFRLISSTNRNLPKLIEENKFREDFYYRIAVITLEVPPLAERFDDVNELLHTFMRLFCEKYKIHKQLTDNAFQALLHYPWPGNVRELKNTIENLVVSTPGKRIDITALPSHFVSVPYENTDLKNRVGRYESQLIKEALHQHGSIRKTAKSLGIHHATLLKKMQNYQIHAEDHQKRDSS